MFEVAVLLWEAGVDIQSNGLDAWIIDRVDLACFRGTSKC